MKQLVSRLFLSVIGLVLSSAAWAGITITPATNTDPYSYVPATDLSLHYLSDLFGNVPNILPGSGAGIMGQLFYVLNEGILVVAGIWLAFTIFKLVLSAGLEGTIHGPQKKWAMTFFRIVIGLALLIPGSSGYSAVQDLMMKVVVEGVHLADETWAYALNYMQDGGMLFVVPSTTSNDVSAMQSYATQSNGSSLVDKVFLDESRMYASNVFNQNKVNWAANPTIKADAGYSASPLFMAPSIVTITNENPYTDPATGKTININGTYLIPGFVMFPGVGDAAPYSVENLSNASGTIVAYPGHYQKITASSNANLEHAQQSYAALRSLVQGILPVAQEETSAALSNGPVPTPQVMASMMANAVIGYVHLMTPYARSRSESLSTADTQFIATAKAEGWAGAGSFYWDLANLNDAAQGSVNLSGMAPSVIGSHLAPIASPIISSQLDSILAATGTAMSLVPSQISQAMGASYGNNAASAGMNGDAADGAYVNAIMQGETPTQAEAAAKAQGELVASENAAAGKATVPVNDSFDTGGVDFASIIQDSLSSIITTVGNIETAGASNHAFYDPLMFVEAVGKACLSAAGNIWAKSIAWIIGLSAVSGICASVNPGSTIVNAMSSWLTPVWQAVATALFAAGFMLTFYAPLYPYLLFMFGIIGWIIYVLEAMVAAPLVAFGMTHPEGDDYVGAAQQALMLALGVFLRPALMVVGFIGAMMLSYIGFSIVNFSFGQVLEEVGTQAHIGTIGTNVLPAIWNVVNGGTQNGQSSYFTGHDLSDFLLIPLLMVGYGLIVIEVVNQSFSLIHVLPDMVLRWIGGPVQQDMSERYASQIQSGLSGSARQGAQTAGQGATGFGSFMGSQFVQPATETASNMALGQASDALQSGGSSSSAGGDGAGAGDAAEMLVAL
jgi:defect-in-organelle-trafficking protein DotA